MIILNYFKLFYKIIYMNKKYNKKPIKDYSHLGFLQLKKLKNQIEAKQAIQQLNKIYNENIQRQINNNLLNEYTRIRNYLESTMPPGTRNTANLEKRLKEIKEIEKMKIV